MPRLTHLASGVLSLASTIAMVPAEARLVRLDIDSREVIADGMAFGQTGPYEKLTGTAYFEVDPRDPLNAQVFDIDKAQKDVHRNVVEFSADTVILKPVDISKGNGQLFFEVNNRGNKIALPMFNDTGPTANNNNPSTPADFGNGFLMRQGYVVAWVGWGADVAPGNNRLTVNFPIAVEGEEPITERIVTEYSDRNFGGETPFTLPLSGGAAFKPFEAVDTNAESAEAELRRRPSDSPRPPGPQIPAGEVVPTSEWSFANCPGGTRGITSPLHICLFRGFQNNMVYELRYRATKSPVMGLGYLTSRDFVSFLKHDRLDANGRPNPVPGLSKAICLGISSSGMYYRDYLYQGFNEDELGRQVCDGVHIHIPGVHKLYLNYRFAQPNPFSVQHRERFVPDANFPRRYQLESDPVTGKLDGVLNHPQTDPKIIHTDTSTEYWQFRSSLVDTDDLGTTDLRHPRNVRRYLYCQHAALPDQGRDPDLRHRRQDVRATVQCDAPGGDLPGAAGVARGMGAVQSAAAGRSHPHASRRHARGG